MKPWRKSETADIVYPDEKGIFTKLLLDKGHLEGDRDKWEGKVPEYLIEVKMTISPSANRPFCTSRKQIRIVCVPFLPSFASNISPLPHNVL
ncbi:hypothetical protein F4802DRAFT_545998 [Xylaria palmicola]|nr:hypothetical protein F4802DRAFT_545998 [Xylaria palmicola]